MDYVDTLDLTIFRVFGSSELSNFPAIVESYTGVQPGRNEILFLSTSQVSCIWRRAKCKSSAGHNKRLFRVDTSAFV